MLLLEENYERLSDCEPIGQVWIDALRLLTDDYWRKFRFNPRSIASYGDSPYEHEVPDYPLLHEEPALTPYSFVGLRYIEW